MKPGIEHTSQLAQWYGLEAIKENETESDFRHRISGALRDRGKVIEAHEAHTNMRYDDPEAGPMGPMNGIMGAAAMALAGRDYGSTGSRKVGDEIAAGIYSQKPEPDPMMLMLAMMLTRR